MSPLFNASSSIICVEHSVVSKPSSAQKRFRSIQAVQRSETSHGHHGPRPRARLCRTSARRPESAPRIADDSLRCQQPCAFPAAHLPCDGAGPILTAIFSAQNVEVPFVELNF